MTKGFRPGFKKKLQEKRTMNEFKALVEEFYETAYIKLTQENYTLLVGDKKAISMANDIMTIENAFVYLKSIGKEIEFPIHFVKKDKDLETIVETIKREMDNSSVESKTSELYCIKAIYNQLTDKLEIELIHIKDDTSKLKNIRRLIRNNVPLSSKFDEYEKQVDEKLEMETKKELFTKLMVQGIAHTAEKEKRKEGDLQS